MSKTIYTPLDLASKTTILKEADYKSIIIDLMEAMKLNAEFTNKGGYVGLRKEREHVQDIDR